MRQFLIIPLVPPSLNKWYEGTHWAKRNKIAKEWHKAIHFLCKDTCLQPFNRYPVIITTQCSFKYKRIFDVSNLFTANKLAEDGLVKAKILKDDDPRYVVKHVVLQGLYGQPRNETTVWIESVDWEMSKY